MNYQTALMQQILTNEKAQEIIDYVSQIYGDSYVGLWLFQAIGSALEPVCDLSEQLQYETSPATATMLIPYYEQQYGIQGDSSLTIEQRRANVIAAMRSKGPCNPTRLANAISAVLGGVPVEIIEYDGRSMGYTEIEGLVVYGQTTGIEPDGDTCITNDEIEGLVIYGNTTGGSADEDTALSTSDVDDIVIYGTTPDQTYNLDKNQFVVNIQAAVKSYAPAIAVIERMKPAHLTYRIQGVLQESVSTDIDIATAMTFSEMFTIRAANTQTVIETPVLISGALKIKRRNPVTGAEAIIEVPCTDETGTVTLAKVKSTNDGAGTVSLESKITT